MGKLKEDIIQVIRHLSRDQLLELRRFLDQLQAQRGSRGRELAPDQREKKHDQ